MTYTYEEGVAQNIVDSSLAAGTALGEEKGVNEEAKPYAVIPKGYVLHDLEETLPAPMRKRGIVQTKDVDGFVRYIEKHGDTNTEIYGDVEAQHFVAVFNGHSKDEPGWGDHRVSYSCPLSHEWKTWSGKNGRAMSQGDFAQFIEDNLPDIVVPSGADMLEISRTLEAKKKVQFASGIRLQDGQQELVYEETISGTAAKGKVKIPETFVLGIRVFRGGDPYRVEARLRYRIIEAKLQMWYDLVRPHKIIEAAVKDVWNKIEAETKLHILHAEPV